MKINAYAKINLGLDVVNKRPDGYHNVRMIMQTVTLCDTLSFELNNSGCITLETNANRLPVNENNLVYKAAKLLKEEFHISQGIHIFLNKQIPVAAGLAGGSSDCAATLKALNQLFELNLSLEELQKRGVTLGADVPFCLLGGTALSQGIGDILTPLPSAPPCQVLIIKPNQGISTRYVYENLNLQTLNNHPDIDGMIGALQHTNIHQLASQLENVLESVTIQKYPMIDHIKKQMLQYGALGSLMSGSGPSVFGLFDDSETAKKAYDMARKIMGQHQIFLTEFTR